MKTIKSKIPRQIKPYVPNNYSSQKQNSEYFKYINGTLNTKSRILVFSKLIAYYAKQKGNLNRDIQTENHVFKRIDKKSHKKCVTFSSPTTSGEKKKASKPSKNSYDRTADADKAILKNGLSCKHLHIINPLDSYDSLESLTIRNLRKTCTCGSKFASVKVRKKTKKEVNFGLQNRLKHDIDERFLNTEKHKKRSTGGNKEYPIAKVEAASNRGLTSTAKPFWGYVQPLVNGYEPLKLKKNDGDREVKYVFGTSKSSDYNMTNHKLISTAAAKRMRLHMFTIVKTAITSGFYSVYIKGSDFYIDNERIGPTKVPLKAIHYLAFGKNLKPIFRIVISPPHDYRLPITYELKNVRKIKFGNKSHFLNMYIVEHLLIKRPETNEKQTYVAFSYRVMDVNVLQVIKSNSNAKENEMYDEKVKSEIVLLQKNIDCKYILKLLDYSHICDNLYLAFPLYKFGTLSDRIENKRLTIVQIKVFFNQILSALLHLHGKKIVHGAVYPCHVLLTSNESVCQIKLCNFSYAFKGRKKAEEINKGDVSYLAPEVVRGNDWLTVNFKADIWSFGVSLFECLAEKHPFNINKSEVVENKTAVIKKICNMDFDLSVIKKNRCNEGSCKLIEKILKKSPLSRPNAMQMTKDKWLDDDTARKICANFHLN